MKSRKRKEREEAPLACSTIQTKCRMMIAAAAVLAASSSHPLIRKRRSGGSAVILLSLSLSPFAVVSTQAHGTDDCTPSLLLSFSHS